MYGLPCRTGYHAAQDTAPYKIRSHMRYHAVRNTAATPYEMPCRVRYCAVREIIRLARHLPTLASLRSSVIVAREGFGE